MNAKPKRRFIANATCPNCKSVDTLYVFAHALNDAFECAECGYREERPKESPDEHVETVKFIDATELSELKN